MSFVRFTPLGTIGQETSNTPAPSRKGILIQQLNRENAVDFEKEILPLFKASCIACHNKTTTKGELNLETPALILKGGESGPAAVPGKPSESLLLKLAAHIESPRMPPRDNKVSAIDFTPEQLGLIQLWIQQGAKGEVRGQVTLSWQPLPESVRGIFAVAVSSDGRYAASARGNRVSLFDLPFQKELAPSPGFKPTPPPLTRTILPAATQISTNTNTSAQPQRSPAAVQSQTSHNSQASILPIPDDAIEHIDWVGALDFSPTGDRLASASFRQIKIWKRRNPTIHSTPLSASSSRQLISSILSTDGQVRASRYLPGSVDVSDVKSGRPVRTFQLSGDADVIMGLSANGDQIVICGENGDFSIFNCKSGKQIGQGHVDGGISALNFDGPRDRILFGTRTGGIADWKQAARAEGQWSQVSSFNASSNRIVRVTSPLESGTVALADKMGQIVVLKKGIGQVLHRLDHGTAVMSLELSSDAKSLASAGMDGSLKVWELKSDGKNVLLHEGGDRRPTLLTLQRHEREVSLTANLVNIESSRLTTATNELTNQTDRHKKATEALTAAEKTSREKTEAESNAAKNSTETTAQLKQLEEAQAEFLGNLRQWIDRQAKLIDPLKLTNELAALTNKFKSEIAEKRKVIDQKAKDTTKTLETARAELMKANLALANAKNELELAVAGVNKSRDDASSMQQAYEEARLKSQLAQTSLKQQRGAKATHPLVHVSLNAESKELVTIDSGGLLQIWCLGQSKPIDHVQVDTGLVLAARKVSPNTFVIATEKEQVTLSPGEGWELERSIGGGITSTNNPFADRVTSLKFSSDGKLLATGGGSPSRSGEIHLWNLQTGVLVRSYTNVHSDVVFALDFSRDGKRLASSSADRFAKITDLETGSIVKALEGHTDYVLGVGWRADDRAIVTGGADNLIKVWDALSGERKRNIDGASKEITAVSFVGTLDHTLSASGDGQLRLSNEKGEKLRSFEAGGDYLQSCDVTPAGDVIVAGGGQGILRAWDAAGKSIAVFNLNLSRP